MKPIDLTEAVLEVMRDIRREADRANDEHRKLLPPFGSIAVGGAHMDPFFRSEALCGFLRALGNRKSVPEAIEAGNVDANFAITKWNQSRKDYQVHRALNGERTHLEELGRRITKASKEKIEQTPCTTK